MVRPRDTGLPSAIRTDVKLVLIPVTVTDTFGVPFSGLPKDSFRLYEDGVEQEVKSFSMQDAPVSLGIVFDASRSMEGKLDQSREAVAQFLRASMPGDEFFAVEFNDSPRILCDFTSDTAEIEKALSGIKSKNWTALLDAVYMAIQQMKHAKNPRKALLVLSDGGDNNSRYTESELNALVREADVCIYSIGIGSGGGLIKRHAHLLGHLAEETGGRLHRIDKVRDLPEAIAKISGEIRNQYVLGYSSKDPRNNGLYRKIEVRLNHGPEAPRLSASWRTGYYAPAVE